MSFRFVANLRPRSYESFDGTGFNPAEWLLSSHRLTSMTRRLALRVREQGTPLMADNGTKVLIDHVVSQFTDRVRPITKAIVTMRQQLPDSRTEPTAGDVPRRLQRDASNLAHVVLDRVDDILAERDLEQVLRDQLAMQPTSLIASEDFATAVLMALGLERDVTRWPVEHFDRRNRTTLELWQAVATDPRCAGIRVYATLSAVDYNTARSAGRLAAESGVSNLALGFAGVNMDARWVTSYLAGTRRHLPDPAPRRYVRAAAIARGLRDGMRDKGERIAAFHALGLGAAAEFPVLVAALDASTAISADATSPLYDAVNDQVFYDPEDRAERVSVTEGAERVVRGGRWPFLCPFCRAIRRELGYRPADARAWWLQNGKPKISRADLARDAPLGIALPIFAIGRGRADDLLAPVRSAHNHWALDRLAGQIPTGSDRVAWAKQEMNTLIATRHRSVAAGVRGARAVIAELNESVSPAPPQAGRPTETPIAAGGRAHRVRPTVDPPRAHDPTGGAAMTGSRALPLESYPPFTASAPQLVGEASTAVETFKGLMLGQNWELVQAESGHLAGLADLLLRHIQTRTDLFGHSAGYLSARDSALKDAFLGLATDTSAQADDIRAAMLTQLSDSLGSAAEAQAMLDALLIGEHPLFTSRSSAKTALRSEQEIMVTAQAQLAVLSARAARQAAAFQAHDDVIARGLGPVQDADTGIIADELTTLTALHDTTIQSVYDALGADAGRQDFTDLCTARAAQITRRLPTCAVLVGGYLGLLRHGRPSGDLLEEHRGVLALVEVMHRLSLVHAYLCVVRAETAAVDADRWYSTEKQRTKPPRELPSQIPSGEPEPIQAVVGGGVTDGTLVQLEGHVAGLVIEDDPAPPKFSSLFELHDLAAGVSIRVRAHMFSLRNNGLHDGAFTRLNGYVRANPSWASPVGLDLDRISLTELRRTSWYDDVTYRLRELVVLYPDEMNMCFTPATGEG